MSKELIEKVMRAGLVDRKAAKLLDMWGLLEIDVTGVRVATAKEELLDLVKDIAELVDDVQVEEVSLDGGTVDRA